MSPRRDKGPDRTSRPSRPRACRRGGSTLGSICSPPSSHPRPCGGSHRPQAKGRPRRLGSSTGPRYRSWPWALGTCRGYLNGHSRFWGWGWGLGGSGLGKGRALHSNKHIYIGTLIDMHPQQSHDHNTAAKVKADEGSITSQDKGTSCMLDYQECPLARSEALIQSLLCTYGMTSSGKQRKQMDMVAQWAVVVRGLCVLWRSGGALARRGGAFAAG